LILGAATAADAAKRVALVIGTDTYATLPDLNNAATDAKGMSNKLRSLGFDVILKVNADQRAIGRAIDDFENRLRQAEVALVFYAGHGVQARGKNWLIPADAKVETESDLRFEGIGADEFLQSMERAGTKLNIVILDACRDNPLPRRSRSASRGLAVPIVPAGIQGTAIVYSAAPGQTAQDGPSGGHGVFTGELLKVLDQPGLTLEKVFKETAARVAATTNGKQDPWINSSVKGDFYFRAGGNQAKAAPKATTGLTPEMLFWQSIQNSKRGSDYEAYLAQYPSGVFAGLARSRLAGLTETKAAPPVVPPKTRTDPSPDNQETLFWQSIKGSKNPADYQDYLMAFPNGTFARLAKRRVGELSRKQVAVARRPSAARSQRSERLRGQHIWVNTKSKSRGMTFCRRLRAAGMIVECDAGRGGNSSNNIFVTCPTLPADTGEIVKEILGLSGHRVIDERNAGAHKDCNGWKSIRLYATE